MRKAVKSDANLLRQDIEESLKKKSSGKNSESEILKLINELEVQQVELKLQNEELEMARTVAQVVTEKYTDLYDFAPLGYFTLSREGEIIEINISGSQMLGKKNSEFKNNRFGFFVSDETKLIFNNFLNEIFNNKNKITCEVTITTHHNLPINVQLTGIISGKGEHCLVIASDITDRKRTEVVIQVSETRYRRLFESAKDGILILDAETGKIIDANPFLIDLLGYSKEKFVDKEIWEFGFFKDIAANKDKFLELQKKKYIRYDDLPFESSDGRKVHVEFVSNVYLEDKKKVIQCNIRDITNRKKAEKELTESEEKYKRFFEEDLTGDFLLNEKGILLDCNNSFLKIFGYDDKQEIIGKNVTILYNDISEFEIIKSNLKKNKALKNNESIRKRKNGDLIYIVENKVASFNAAGEITEIIGYIYDITDRKDAETKLMLKNEELQKLNAEKDKFFSIIAHDLRNPFSAFLGLTELMAEGLFTMSLDEIQKTALLMRSSASNIYRLLGNLLEWSRMQRGLTTFVPTTFLLMPKISAIMDVVLDGANKKEIKVTYSVPEDLAVFADGNMIDVIIRNLVSNAVKFTTVGGNITVSARYISDKSVSISIKDSGIGMNKELIEHLFRLDVNTNRKGTEGEESTGLGLIICKDFVKKHGGELFIKSEEGKGSTFRFSLPANPESTGVL